MKKSYKPSLDQIFAKVRNKRQKFGYKDGVLCIIAFTIVTVMTIFLSAGTPRMYMVKVGDKTIGYINDYDIYKSAIKDIKDINGDVNLDNVIAERTSKVASNTKMLSTTELRQAASKELGFKMASFAIYANDVQLAVVSSKSDVDKVLEGVIKAYYPKVSNGKVTISSSKILEKITTKQVMSSKDAIMQVNDAIKKIVNGRGAQKKYTIKNGDTIWDIALSHDLSVEDIKAANPKMNIDRIKIGQVINLAVNLPYLNVRIVASIDSKENIPFESKIQTDKKLRKGLKKVKARGKNGLAQINKKVTIENGNVISENVISSKTLVAAKDEVVVIGGKSLMYVATGTFIKPARGILTSKFGRRWGRMHQGIDIAGPTGSTIKAADNGVVTFVGRSYGYGNCVMIKHGKGIQTLYGHASRTYVKVGQTVRKGQKIAAVGSTGRSTGPHLHFEIRKNNTPINPLPYIR